MTSTLESIEADLYSRPVSELLARVIAFAHRGSDSELERWARLELHGYNASNPVIQASDVVPTYRTVSGFHSDEMGRRLVLAHVELGFVNETRVRWGASELEQLTARRDSISIEERETIDLIRRHIQVDVTRFTFDSSQLSGVLMAIRAELARRLPATHSNDARPVSPANQAPIVELKPNFYGIGIDLRALWSRFHSRKKK